jgi:hypothetical protein
MAENIVPEWVVDPATGQKYLIVAPQSVDANNNAVTDPAGNPLGNVGVSPLASYSGTEKTYAMVSSIDGSAPSGTAEIYDNANGVKAFNITYDQTIALTAKEIIVVAWSTTATDANVLTNLQNFITEADKGGTRTGQAYYNIAVLTPDLPSVTVTFDGVNTIKRISTMTTDAADKNVILTVVE